jgi:general secretion pathway protein J
MPPRARPSALSGFTLVELLVVIAVFGLLSAILFGGFHFATRTVAAGTARLDRAEQLTLVAGFLRNQLSDIRPFPASPSAIAFAGEAGALRFIAAPPSQLAPGGFHALRIAAERVGHDGRLVLHWDAMPDAGEDAPAIRPSVLLDGLAEASFAYFGAAGTRQAPDWQEEWNGARGLPALIRLRLVFADHTPAPDIIVAVQPAVAASR